MPPDINTFSIDRWKVTDTTPTIEQTQQQFRRHFIGDSDARIIMGKDEKALPRLWQEKRGEESAPDLSSVLVVRLGLVTENLNRGWCALSSGHKISDVQRHAVHRTMPWMAATLDGLVKEWRRIRGQVHAALVLLRGGRR